MSVPSGMSPSSGTSLDLLMATRAAATAAERQFVLLNHSRGVWPYQVAVLWRGVSLSGHSGVGRVEAQGPYAQWLDRCRRLLADRPAGPIAPGDLEAEWSAEWQTWWPAFGLWLPLDTAEGGALLLVRDLPWSVDEVVAAGHWVSLWSALDEGADARARVEGSSLGVVARAVRRAGARWRLVRWLAAVALLAAVSMVPVQLTLRAPGELVARDPVVLRAPVDGTVRTLKVEPNQPVVAGQVLAELDDAGWSSRLLVAQQAMRTAEAEWRQTSQQALNDPRAKSQLAAAQGRYDERRSEAEYLQQQLERTVVKAPHAGVVLIQDPGGWPGRTVVAGEALMKLARPDDQELEAWLAVGDAVDLPQETSMQLYLTNRPAQPVAARLKVYAFEAEHRPESGLGYRLRGRLTDPTGTRLGARGTVRIEGPTVPLVYWVLRRPLAALRETTGW